MKKDSWTGIEENQVLSEEFLGQLLGTPSECQTFDFFFFFNHLTIGERKKEREKRRFIPSPVPFGRAR